MPGVSFNVTIPLVQQQEAGRGSERLGEDRTIPADIRGGAVILVLCSIFSDAE